ncbi:MAG: helix-turn-helix transcriptional regulator [Clostridia bacterium]|nr:helix-turn-helix transcriptional regulator [Clostridia bacterium]
MYFERHVFSDSDLPIYFQFQQRTTAEPIFQLHWHETLELIYITENSVEIRINDKTEIYSAGELVVINPQSAHNFRAVGKDCSYYCLIPDNALLSSFGISPGSLSVRNRIHDEEIVSVYKQLIRETNERKSMYKSCARAYINLMVSLLVRNHTVDQHTAKRFDDNSMSIAKDAIHYIEEHYAEPIDGIIIADALGISRSYLCHVIRKVTNQTLTENLMYVRCRKAKELLWAGYSINQILYQTGFNNTSHFCRTYKKMMGVPPSFHKKNKSAQERKNEQ